MSKPHASLSPGTNIILICVWAGVAGFLLFVSEPHVPLSMAGIGLGLGAVCGYMQHLSFKQAAAKFTEASSLLEVRRALKTTIWGRRYIWWLYFSKCVLAISAFLVIRQPLLGILLGYLAGYMSLMFIRELVTLRDAVSLSFVSSRVIRQ